MVTDFLSNEDEQLIHDQAVAELMAAAETDPAFRELLLQMGIIASASMSTGEAIDRLKDSIDRLAVALETPCRVPLHEDGYPVEEMGS
jgi:hypothetical protein